MSGTLQETRPIRVGVFSHVADADNLVQRLLDAGFTIEQISVVCSNKTIEAHFARFHHQDPAGTSTPAAAAAGGAIGAAIGGLGAAVALPVVAGAGLVAVGSLMLFGAGGVVGGLVGAMMTRGVEKELANFYNQSVLDGDILVAVEAHGRDTQKSLAKAEEIIASTGAKPLPLEEG